jgi:hypothetical protein
LKAIHFRKTRAARNALLAAAVTMTLDRSARAITELDNVPDSQYINFSAQSQYSSVGYVDAVQNSNTGAFASGVLIAPDWVLTVAHAMFVNGGSTVFNPSNVSFGQGAATTAFQTASNSVSQILVDPKYTGDVTTGDDLALIQLTTPITNVAPATLFTSALGSELNKTLTVVGYGYTGTGLTGYNPANGLGTRRAMQNTVDAFGGQITTGGLGQTNTYDFSSVSSKVMLTDFDSPSNSAASVMGSTTPLGLEGASVPGDSGGGAYITINGKTYLAGISSFEGAFGDNPYSTNADGHYGDFNGYTRLSSADSINFLDSMLAVSSSWSQGGGGTWAGLNNWSNGNIPEFSLATANFGGAILGASAVTLDASWTVGALTFNNLNSYTLAPGSGGSLTLDSGSPTTAATITVNAGSHQITAPLNLNTPLKVTSTFSSVLTLSGKITGTVGLTVSGGGTLRFGSGVSTPTFTSLQVNTGATLDITTNAVAINFGSPANDPVASISTLLASGYNHGLWTGTGINSSTAAAGSNPALAVGYADGNTDTGSQAAPNQILIKYTLAGDANLDGLVNFADLVAVVQNFNKAGTDWAQGNFAYGASTSFADLVAVVQNFNKVLAPAFTAGVGTPDNFANLGVSTPLTISNTSVQLPEPGAAGSLLVGAAWLAGRGRKKPRMHLKLPRGR